MREKPAAIVVYWVYCARVNNENVAWPSLRGLSNTTRWSTNSCADARKWLVEHGALERVTDYIKPEWRDLPEDELKQRQNLDKTEYYRPTGVLKIDGSVYPMLYIPQAEDGSGIDESTPDVSSGATSHRAEHGQDDTELDSSIELDSNINTANAVQDPTPPRTTNRCDLFTFMLKTLYDIEYESGMKLDKRIRGHVNGIVATLQDENVSPVVTVDDAEEVVKHYKGTGLTIPRNGASWLAEVKEHRTRQTRTYSNGMTVAEAEAAAQVMLAQYAEADADALVAFERITGGANGEKQQQAA